jgi:CheY-like chemotaxis protein
MAVINDVLDFSKIEAGRLELEPAPFLLREAVADAMRTMAVRAHAKDLEFLWRVAPGVPDALVGDAGRLRQVLLNLVGNAVKFTEQGEIVVEVEAERPGEEEVCLRFEVRDTGIGIPPEKQQAVFEAFVQADGSTTRRYGGTGLGLTISSRLVALMRGRIGVTSEPGRGSTFAFTAVFGKARPGELAGEAIAGPDLQGLRVLVVDDNATNRRILHEMLATWNMRPTAVADGAAAVAALEAAAAGLDSFRLVLLDQMMPGVDGAEAVRRIRALPRLPPTPIVILSSASGADGRGRRDVPADAWLTKPVRQSDLLDVILSLRGRVRPAPPRPARAPVPPAAGRDGGRILLAEDNLVNQRLALRLLERRGYLVTVAATGHEAVDLIEAGDYEAVLMDVQMPDMNGFEATSVIRRRERVTGRHVPIIAMTAHAMTGDRERCLEAGMDDYVPKPIDAASLYAAIDRAMSRAGAGAQPPSPLDAGEREPGGRELTELRPPR